MKLCAGCARMRRGVHCFRCGFSYCRSCAYECTPTHESLGAWLDTFTPTDPEPRGELPSGVYHTGVRPVRRLFVLEAVMAGALLVYLFVVFV